jgi:carboxyl-terminal processing protease
VNLKVKNRLLLPALLFCFLSSSLFAENDASQVPLKERVYIASRVYASLISNFAHTQGVPDVDADAAYRLYLDKVLAADSLKAFSLATMQFLATFRNTHTLLIDRVLIRQPGPVPFVARFIQGQWVVTSSLSPDLNPGDVLEKIDEKSFEQFFSEVRPYISASSDYSARYLLFSHLGDIAPCALLFPDSFELTLSGNRKVKIDRHATNKTSSASTEGRWLKPGQIAYIRIPSFFFPDNEKHALELVRGEFKQARAIIVDVRGNAGGATPSDLTSALMDRPYRWWTESTPIDMPFFRYRASQGDWHYQPFRDPQFTWQSPVQPPAKDTFTGKLVLLVDGGCNSACEDFTMPFKDNHRALIVGQTTSGSTGQPYVVEFDNGMLLLIGAKRASFPDGTPFEGVGIKPDIEVQPTPADLAKGRDVALEAALHALGD